MDTKNNGGPAFGQVVELRCVRVDPTGAAEYEPETITHGGLTVRDYFAAKVMQSLISNSNGRLGVGHEEANQRYAKAAYSIADAVLAERTK